MGLVIGVSTSSPLSTLLIKIKKEWSYFPYPAFEIFFFLAQLCKPKILDLFSLMFSAKRPLDPRRHYYPIRLAEHAVLQKLVLPTWSGKPPFNLQSFHIAVIIICVCPTWLPLGGGECIILFRCFSHGIMKILMSVAEPSKHKTGML